MSSFLPFNPFIFHLQPWISPFSLSLTALTIFCDVEIGLGGSLVLLVTDYVVGHILFSYPAKAVELEEMDYSNIT